MCKRPIVGVVDVGSNSIKLLLAKAGKTAGTVETVFAETLETRISGGISRALPSLSNEALEAGTRSIRELFEIARSYHPVRIEIVATSMVRDAINGGELIERVEAQTGIRIRLLSGVEEASYVGRGLVCDPKMAKHNDFFQIDIGGGSLELIHFAGGQIEQACSLQLGAVRLTELFVRDIRERIGPEVAAAIRAHVTNAIRGAGFSFKPESTPLVATGGAFVIARAILAARAGLAIEQSAPELSLEAIQNLKSELMAMPLHERLAVPHLPASRADIVPTALQTIETVMKLSNRNRLTHSFYNLRYGIAAELLASPQCSNA